MNEEQKINTDEQVCDDLKEDTVNSPELEKNGKKTDKNRSSFIKGTVFGALFVLLLCLLLIVGNSIFKRIQSRKFVSLMDYDSISKLNTLNYMLNEYYYEDVPVDDRQDGIFKGLIRSTGDPYGDYYTPEEVIKFQQDYDGIFGGIGATVSYDTSVGYCYVVEVIEGSPAEKGGVEAGDYFLSVEGVNAREKSSSELVQEIRGEVGSDVDISFMRDGKQIDVTITRDLIESINVTYKKEENTEIGYIDIAKFDAVTPKQFKDALSSAKADNVKGIVFDLRGNPGGNVSAVVEMLGEICPQGVVVYTEDKKGNRVDYTSDGNNSYNYPTVVLVDRNSASCSEIFAGALKDLNIATIMGKTTYGKGIVQEVIPLTDGSAVKLTVSKYYTPNGTNFHGVGIEPDEVVEFDGAAYLADETDTQHDAAIEYLEKMIK